jgi:hypothetical protein
MLRELEFYREGRSSKHAADIRAICGNTAVDAAVLAPWLGRLALAALGWELSSAE